MKPLTISQRLDQLMEEFDRLSQEMNALPNLDRFGIPNDLESPEGQKWEEPLHQSDAVTHEMCQLVINHKPGQQYPDPTEGE
ncbi:MAG: hypothetical protein SPI77_04165 [Corynebacterium sp.]|nr:hypothetical protein [Corynebacterium sp.]